MTDTTAKDLVIACDQRNRRIVLYDVSRMEHGGILDEGEIWSFDFGSRLGAVNPSGVKFRRATVFGDVIVTCASGGYAGIIRYPSKEVVWETASAGRNPHSVELLPNGDLVCAASTGNSLRLYHTSALLDGDSKRADTNETYSFYGAHGVLWDPAKEILWALGEKELKAYALKKTGISVELTECPTEGAPLPASHPSGHDLSPDFSSIHHLYLTTNTGILRFHKDSKTFSRQFQNAEILDVGPATSFGNNPNGNFALSQRDGGRGTPWQDLPFAAWCTATVQFARKTESGTVNLLRFSANDSAFYKARIFYGNYQSR